MIALLLQDRCTGCQRCVQVCPATVFEPSAPGTPPTIAHAADCQTCFGCELHCDADALYVEPDVNRLVAVDEAVVRASGLLGVYRRHSGWGEFDGDPRYPNLQHRMEEVFARGRAAAATPSPLAAPATDPPAP